MKNLLVCTTRIGECISRQLCRCSRCYRTNKVIKALRTTIETEWIANYIQKEEL